MAPFYKMPEAFPYYCCAGDGSVSWSLPSGARLLPAASMPEMFVECTLPVSLSYLAEIGYSMWENTLTKQTFFYDHGNSKTTSWLPPCQAPSGSAARRSWPRGSAFWCGS